MTAKSAIAAQSATRFIVFDTLVFLDRSIEGFLGGYPTLVTHIKSFFLSRVARLRCELRDVDLALRICDMMDVPGDRIAELLSQRLERRRRRGLIEGDGGWVADGRGRVARAQRLLKEEERQPGRDVSRGGGEIVGCRPPYRRRPASASRVCMALERGIALGALERGDGDGGGLGNAAVREEGAEERSGCGARGVAQPVAQRSQRGGGGGGGRGGVRGAEQRVGGVARREEEWREEERRQFPLGRQASADLGRGGRNERREGERRRQRWKGRVGCSKGRERREGERRQRWK